MPPNHAGYISSVASSPQTDLSSSYAPSASFILSSLVNSRLCGGVLGHGVQGTAILEPLDLGLVEGVLELDLEVLALLRVDDHSEGLANRQLSGKDVNLQVVC